jgi:hypothetical protein
LDPVKRKAKPQKSGRQRTGRGTKRPLGGKWRIKDLPPHLRVELRDRLAQAKRGEDLKDFDEAMAEAERMTDELLAVVARRSSKA